MLMILAHSLTRHEREMEKTSAAMDDDPCMIEAADRYILCCSFLSFCFPIIRMINASIPTHCSRKKKKK